MNTGRTPQNTSIEEYLSERQEALHAFNHLKEHFGLAWTDLRKTMALFVITIRKGAELSAFEARRSRILKKLKREEQEIRAKYQKETAKALNLAPAKRSATQKTTEFVAVFLAFTDYSSPKWYTNDRIYMTDPKGGNNMLNTNWKLTHWMPKPNLD